MIELRFGSNEYSFPNKWEELSPDQYMKLVPLLNLFWAGEISLMEVRTSWFKQIAGLEGIKVPKDRIAQVADNIYTASRQFNFFYKIDYDGKTDSFPADIRRLLEKTAPDDLLDDSAEVRYASTLKYGYKPDSVWAKNLIPSISVKGTALEGWKVSVDGDALTSTLTALQFLQGNDILTRLTKNRRRQDIALLCSILYPAPDGSDISVADYDTLEDNILFGVVQNFQAFVSFIFTRTQFSILWATGKVKKRSRSVSISQTDALYSLSKSGYGSYEQIERMPMTTYLSIVRADMISAIRSLVDSKMTLDEIAERVNLPIEIINKIVS